MRDLIESGIIEPHDAHALLNQPAAKVRFIDCSYGVQGVQAFKDNFDAARIYDAVFFDIDHISDAQSPYPHMMPDTDVFEQEVRKLGINGDELLICYEQNGMLMAPARVWWMFRVFGHDNICVLSGGLPAWIAEGYSLQETPPSSPATGDFTATFNPATIKTTQDVAAALGSSDVLVCDARPAGRFNGTEPEPRAGLESGHIEGSVSLPSGMLVDPDNGKFKDRESLHALFANLGFTGDQHVLTTCGSGVTACTIYLALHYLGHDDVSVYDGSWSQWYEEQVKNTSKAAP